MRKILFLLVFFVSTVWAQIPTAVIEKARDATVLVANTATEGGMGSGVLIDDSGLVLTNYHVIHRAEKLRVWFYDRRNNNSYTADIIAIGIANSLKYFIFSICPRMTATGTSIIIAEMIEIKIGILGFPAELIIVVNKLDPPMEMHPKLIVINDIDVIRMKFGSFPIIPLI